MSRFYLVEFCHNTGHVWRPWKREQTRRGAIASAMTLIRGWKTKKGVTVFLNSARATVVRVLFIDTDRDEMSEVWRKGR